MRVTIIDLEGSQLLLVGPIPGPPPSMPSSVQRERRNQLRDHLCLEGGVKDIKRGGVGVLDCDGFRLAIKIDAGVSIDSTVCNVVKTLVARLSMQGRLWDLESTDHMT
jgi:hypothetical protein